MRYLQICRALTSSLLFPVVCLAASPAPKLRLAEVQDIAPAVYRADLTLDPERDSFSGSISIKIEVRKPSETIWLNGDGIKVEEASLTRGGRSMFARPLPGGDDFIGFQFDSMIPAGEAELHIRYLGRVRLGDTSGVFRADDEGNHYLLTQFEPMDARDAFPCFDEPSYKVPWQLTLHVPEQDKAVSNTPVASETSQGATRTYIFEETKPLPSYLIAFGVGPFEFVDAGFAGRNHIPVRIVTPKGRTGEARYAAEVTSTILTRLEDYFGVPYPFEKSD
jgi:alanyl aminopeptidase